MLPYFFRMIINVDEILTRNRYICGHHLDFDYAGNSVCLYEVTLRLRECLALLKGEILTKCFIIAAVVKSA